LRGARILVTGATGFTARYVIPLLEEVGAEVWKLSRTAEKGGRAIACDITDARGLRETVNMIQPKYVIHLAGTSNLPDSKKETAFRINVDGTTNLLEACNALHEKPKVLLASSSYVYGDTGSVPAPESRPPAPANEYGRSKLQMERVAATWFDRVPIVIARPFNYTGIGHGEQFLVPKLIKAFRDKSQDLSFVDAAVERDFSDVRWISAVYMALAEKGVAGKVYNVCSGVGTRLSEIVGMLERLSRYRPASGSVAMASVELRNRMVGDPARLRELADMSAFPLEATLAWMFSAGRDVSPESP